MTYNVFGGTFKTLLYFYKLHGWKEDSMMVKRTAAMLHLSSNIYEL